MVLFLYPSNRVWWFKLIWQLSTMKLLPPALTQWNGAENQK